MSVMVGIGKGARNGILIKNAEALEEMEKVNVIITDKTGTLTEGKPSLTQIFSENIPENEALQLAASLNKNSEHPLSQAVLNAVILNTDDKSANVVQKRNEESVKLKIFAKFFRSK